MATLSANNPMLFSAGNIGATGIIANDIVYEGAMVGENGSGYARPLVAGDRFLGHCIEKVDNTGGSAGAKTVQYYTGRYRLRVSLAVDITDVSQPVYASDDDVLTMVATSNSYVGVVTKYISSTECEVEFRTREFDHFGSNTNRTTETSTTLDATDNGRVIYVSADSQLITLPATVKGAKVTIVNGGGDGDVLVDITPNANDKFLGGCGLSAGLDDANVSNTKATARRGDYITLQGDGANGWNIIDLRGTWVQA
jgi:hypothetical protein